jgi:hypothetical protein
MTGAKQWRVPCPHLDEDAGRQNVMASEVSKNNFEFFPQSSEYRVHRELTGRQILKYLEQAQQTDRALVACNQCRALLFVGGGVEVAHRGEARYEGAPVAGGSA